MLYCTVHVVLCTVSVHRHEPCAADPQCDRLLTIRWRPQLYFRFRGLLFVFADGKGIEKTNKDRLLN